MEITEDNTMEAWKRVISFVLNEGATIVDENKRRSKEVTNLSTQIVHPEKDANRPIEMLNNFKKWIYPSTEEILSFTLNKKLAVACDFSYGSSIFNYKGRLNQIDEFVIPLLKKERESRRAVINLWDPEENSNIHQKLFPGMTTMHFRIKNNKLHATCFVRSNDVFFGWPANAYQLFALQSYIQEKINCEIGPVTIFSAVAQVFEDQEEYAKRIVDGEKLSY